MSNRSNTEAVDNNLPALEEEFTRPEQFFFALEEHEGTPIVTICPVDFFEKNGYQEDQYRIEISQFLEDNNFFPISECSYVNGDENLSKETVFRIVSNLKFRQSEEYSKYIRETEADFSFDVCHTDEDETVC